MCVEWANLRRFGRVLRARCASESVGRVCAARGARARLEGGGGAKKGRARGKPRKPIRRAGGRSVGTRAGGVAESAELAACGRRLRSLRGRVAGAGYAVARAGAVIISGRKTKKKGFSPKKNTKNAPRIFETRPRAFIYRRARVFCLPRAGVGAYIARIWTKI